MNLPSSAFARRALAVSIFVLLVCLAVSAVVQSIIGPPQSLRAEIDRLNDELAEVHTAAARETQLRHMQAATENQLHDLAAFWSGPSRTQIAASMQDVLRAAAQNANGQIVSSSVVEETHPGGTLSVRARINGTLATLQGVLTAAETAKPLLFVDSLVVTAPSGPSTQLHAQELSFELSASGYLAAGDRAKP